MQQNIPVEWKTSGSFSNLASQSRTITSSSVAAGQLIQLNPTMLIPALSISPRNPAILLLEGKYAKYPGLCQCVTPCKIFDLTSEEIQNHSQTISHALQELTGPAVKVIDNIEQYSSIHLKFEDSIYGRRY